MKSNKGITLTSLLVYLIIMLIIIGLISTFTKYFYINSEDLVISNNTSEQYSKMISYISNDVNSNNLITVDVGENGLYLNIYLEPDIVHQYIYDNTNNEIYYLEIESNGTIEKKIRLCSEIKNCEFEFIDSTLKVKTQVKDIVYNDKFEI